MLPLPETTRVTPAISNGQEKNGASDDPDKYDTVDEPNDGDPYDSDGYSPDRPKKKKYIPITTDTQASPQQSKPAEVTKTVETAGPAATADLASDVWFAKNSKDGRNRDLQGNVQATRGVLTFLSKAFGWVDYTWTQTLGMGSADIVDGIRSKAEADLISSKTAAEAVANAERQKTLAIAGALSQVGLLLSTVTPSLLVLPIAALWGYLRYRAAGTVEQQVKAIAEKDPAKRAQLASEGWLKTESGRQLPSAMRTLEKYVGYVYGVALAGVALYTITQAPLLALLYGASSAYQFWKGLKAIPPVIDYYESLEKESDAIAKQEKAK